MALILWMRWLISSLWRSVVRESKVRYFLQVKQMHAQPRISLGHGRSGSTVTGVQLATRGRRDMSSRVRDVVLSLALCHNVSATTSLSYFH